MYIRKFVYENSKSQKNSYIIGKYRVRLNKIKKVTYSIYAISSLTNSQIQNVIKNVTLVEPLLETVMNYNYAIVKTIINHND